MQIPKIKTNHKYILPQLGTWKKSVHVFDQRTANAIIAAWLSERPLLVRGDPGTGKSQLARAAAEALNWQFVSEVVSAHTDIQDLWYRFDAVSRLGQAQLLGSLGDKYSKDELLDELSVTKFLSPAALWWAYDWSTAQRYYNDSAFKQYHPTPENDQDQTLPEGVVLLIDEIDKADADLPNSLLETLDNARFRIPWVNQTIGCQADNTESIRPLVIITTNEDRQLPPAFVRRCLVLNLELPEKEPELIAYLSQRGEQHYGENQFTAKVLSTVAEQLYQDRLAANKLGFKPPGQAEYLDILRVLARMNLSEQDQLEKLDEIQDFALKKYPGMKQKLASEREA